MCDLCSAITKPNLTPWQCYFSINGSALAVLLMPEWSIKLQPLLRVCKIRRHLSELQLRPASVNHDHFHWDGTGRIQALERFHRQTNNTFINPSELINNKHMKWLSSLLLAAQPNITTSHWTANREDCVQRSTADSRDPRIEQNRMKHCVLRSDDVYYNHFCCARANGTREEEKKSINERPAVQRQYFLS